MIEEHRVPARASATRRCQVECLLRSDGANTFFPAFIRTRGWHERIFYLSVLIAIKSNDVRGPGSSSLLWQMPLSYPSLFRSRKAGISCPIHAAHVMTRLAADVTRGYWRKVTSVICYLNSESVYCKFVCSWHISLNYVVRSFLFIFLFFEPILLLIVIVQFDYLPCMSICLLPKLSDGFLFVLDYFSHCQSLIERCFAQLPVVSTVAQFC